MRKVVQRIKFSLVLPEQLWFWLSWDGTIIGLVLKAQRARSYFLTATHVKNVSHKPKPRNTVICIIKQREVHTKKCFSRRKATTVETNRISFCLFYVLFDYFSLCNIYLTSHFICLWVSGQSSRALMQPVTAHSRVQCKHQRQHSSWLQPAQKRAPESFFTWTGKHANKWGTLAPEKYRKIPVFMLRTALLFQSKCRRSTNITVRIYKYLVKSLIWRLRSFLDLKLLMLVKKSFKLIHSRKQHWITPLFYAMCMSRAVHLVLFFYVDSKPNLFSLIFTGNCISGTNTSESHILLCYSCKCDYRVLDVWRVLPG